MSDTEQDKRAADDREGAGRGAGARGAEQAATGGAPDGSQSQSGGAKEPDLSGGTSDGDTPAGNTGG